MEAWVIKRDDGKYLSKFTSYNYNLALKFKESWTDNIYNAKIFSSMHNAVLHSDRYHLLGLYGGEIKKVNLVVEEVEENE